MSQDNSKVAPFETNQQYSEWQDRNCSNCKKYVKRILNVILIWLCRKLLSSTERYLKFTLKEWGISLRSQRL